MMIFRKRGKATYNAITTSVEKDHDIWLIISITIGIIGLLFLVLYSSIQLRSAGQAAGQAGDFYFSTCKQSGWANGGTYYLTKNLGSVDAGSSGDCIDITGNDIVLNCMGHSIIGNKTQSSDGIQVRGLNNVVKNCKISDFYNGIVVKTGDTNHQILNNIIKNNSLAGIFLLTVDDIQIKNNRLSGNLR